MEFSLHQFQPIKLGVHIAQAAFILVSWVLEIAVFRSSATVDGRAGWYFGLCFLTVPAIIYLTMTPRFPRTRKFANPYAMVAVDGLFTILWLSAFAAVANWNSTGKCGSGCKLSRVVVGLGVFIWLFFILTTALSVYGCIYYRREGYFPGSSRVPNDAEMIDPDKEAFSTAPHDEYAPVHNTDHHEMHESGPDYGGAGSPPRGGDRYGPPSYSGGYNAPQVHDHGENSAYSGYSGAQNLDAGPGGRVQFPQARYDNV